MLPGIALAGFLPAPVVIAAEYLSVEDAQHALFAQAERFTPVALALDDRQRAALAQLAGAQPTRGTLRIWSAQRDGRIIGHMFVDEVLGRQNLITYAAGIDAAGAITGVEILAYRESHGGEIRNRNWRAQFAGRSGLAQLRFRTDIKNIAGATLSSEHLTQGVRWLMALWQTCLRPGQTE